MASFGPTPNAAQYGENLKKQRGPGPVADRTQAYQPDPIEEDSDLVKGLKVLGSQSSVNNLGPATGKNVPAEKKKVTAAGAMVAPGTSIELAQQAAANTTPIGKETGHPWVTEDPQPLPFDENGMLNGQTAMPFADHVPNVPQNLGVSFDRTKELTGVTDVVTPPEEAPLPPVEAPVEVVDQNNMPAPQTEDPSASLLAGLLGQAGSGDVQEAKTAVDTPENQKILEDKAATGQEMSLGEKIAWVAMMVAPAALGYALRGEKGAYLGGMAAGKGMEVAGKEVQDQDQLNQKIAAEQKLKETEVQGQKDVAILKAKESGSTIERELKAVDIGGKPMMANVYSSKLPGGQSVVEPLTKDGKTVAPSQWDPQTGLSRSQLPDTGGKETLGTKNPDGTITAEVQQPAYYVAPPGSRTLRDELQELGIPLMTVRNPEWLKVEISRGGSNLPLEGIDTVPTDGATRAKFFNEGLAKIISDKMTYERDRQAKIAEFNRTKADKNQDRMITKLSADYRSPTSAITAFKNSSLINRSAMDAGAQVVQDKFSKHGEGEGVRQVGIIYAFIKALDPNSAVREGEIDFSQKATPLGESIANIWGKLSNGEILPKETVNAMERAIQARQIINYANAYNASKSIKETAAKYGIPSDFVTDPDVENRLKNSPIDFRKINIPNADKYKSEEEFKKNVYYRLPEGGMFIYKDTPMMKMQRYDKNGRAIQGAYEAKSMLD